MVVVIIEEKLLSPSLSTPFQTLAASSPSLLPPRAPALLKVEGGGDFPVLFHDALAPIQIGVPILAGGGFRRHKLLISMDFAAVPSGG